MTFRAMRRFKPPEKRNKHGAKRTEYNGRWFHSRREADYAAQLDLLMHSKSKDRVREWFAQEKWPLEVNGVLIQTFIVDFVVWYIDGRMELHEVKGQETRAWKRTEKLFRACYPNAILKVIK